MRNMKIILRPILLLTAALSAAACAHEKPPIVQTIRLPAALEGHAYETEVVLEHQGIHVSPD